MSYSFEAPHTVPKTIKLVSPFFDGNGKDGHLLYMFHESPSVPIGTVVRTNKGDSIRVVDVYYEEDFFENIEVLVGINVTIPLGTIDITAREAYPMYSTTTQ